MFTPGGGGYGDPLERDQDAVRLDVLRGLVSIERAAEDYGVVVSEARNGRVVDIVVDKGATESAGTRFAPGAGRCA